MNKIVKNFLINALKVGSIALVAEIILFYVTDTLFNGAVADWFTDHFIYQEVDLQTAVVTGNVNWYGLKMFLMAATILLTLAIVFAICFVSLFLSRKKTQECIKELTSRITHYMSSGANDLSDFAGDFASVGVLLGQLRTQALTREKQLEQETARKNDLITYLAHDLKTPLASVIGYLCLLDENPNLPATLREQYTGITLDKAYRLEQLINEFFEITRYNLHDIVINPGKIHLRPMLMQIADEFYPILAPEGKSIVLDIPQDIDLIGDADKLARVFNNLLKNAAAYSDPDSRIHLSAHIVGSYVTVIVTNTGTPIPPHQLDTIFEKFYRLDSSRSSKTGGSGLGLAIAKEIVTAHRGTIQVQSTVENTAFTVMLPLRPDDKALSV